MTATLIRAVSVRPVRLPLRRPFVTALGRKTHSDNVLVRARLAGGAEGWGEASSSLAMPWQTGPKMAAALRRLARAAAGRDARDLDRLTAAAWRAEPDMPTAAAAFECALTDALCRAEGIPFYRRFGGARREIKTLMSLPAVAPETMAARAREGVRRGFDALKLKLDGRGPAGLDRARARAVRRAAPRARLLLDPNQSYAPESLAALLADLAADGIPVTLVEEPFPKKDWAALARFRRRGRTASLLLDESVQTPADAARAARGRLADGVNVKLAKSGLARSRRIAAAFPSGVRMIGCMAESKVGLAAAAQFAMGFGVFDWCDLDSDLLLKPLDIPGGYVRTGPWLRLPKRVPAGLGVSA